MARLLLRFRRPSLTRSGVFGERREHDTSPGPGFTAVVPNLEDVYFSELRGSPVA